MSEHTKEPWTNGFFNGEAFNICSSSDGHLIAEVKNREDRNRIVSCVNACAGLPQDALDGGWTSAGISAYAKKLEQQRDELLAALKGARERMLVSYLHEGEGINKSRRITFMDIEFVDFAIAKAEASKCTELT